MGRASRRKATAQPRTRGAAWLADGIPGPAGTVLRLAGPGEAEQVAALADTTGGYLDDQMRTAIEDGTASTALLSALNGNAKALLESAARWAITGDPTPMAGLSIALVAEHDKRVIGALFALPPGNFISSLVDAGVEPMRAAVVAIAAIKIKAVAVESEYRGHGIASALLDACGRLYDQLGYHLQFGNFAVGSGLETFYADRGFHIVPVGEGIPMEVIIGRPFSLDSGPTEQQFFRWKR